jgi:hypothetical protein
MALTYRANAVFASRVLMPIAATKYLLERVDLLELRVALACLLMSYWRGREEDQVSFSGHCRG